MRGTDPVSPGLLSVLDLFKIGIGPSSSHTLGPWRAAQRFLSSLADGGEAGIIFRLQILLYGSLAKTGRGHGTDLALLLGLSGYDPVTMDTATLGPVTEKIYRTKEIRLGGIYPLAFDPVLDLVFLPGESLPFHPNALTFLATLADGSQVAETFYSTGGGFICREGEEDNEPGRPSSLPYPVGSQQEVLAHCTATGKPLAALLFANELAFRPAALTRRLLDKTWETMQETIYRGCITEGELPGGLGVQRRAPVINKRLLGTVIPDTQAAWLRKIRDRKQDFTSTLEWVSCFALAVNEENAAFGRIVTAPTNGAAGVIPSVLQYACLFHKSGDYQAPIRFLLVAGMIGMLCKKGATLSAALGGCQAEIGVASAMAAAGLADLLGGTPAQVFMAAEIALEHHLGLTCDPVAGLVQVPCIERNAMGAVKAILAAQLARQGNPAQAKVSLDQAIRTLHATGADMHDRYKETSEGGLAVQVPVSLADC